MASWLVRSSPDRSDPGSSLGTSKKFSHPENRGIISNLMITELFYLHTPSITRSSLHARFFRSMHCSVFRYRFTKTGFSGLKSLWGFRETRPCSGTLHCVLGQGCLVSLCLSLGTGELLGKPKKLQGNDLRWTSIPSSGSRNTPSRFMLQRRISSGSYEPVWLQGFTFIWLSRTIIVDHVDAHFEVFTECIAMKNIQGFSARLQGWI